MLKKAYEQGYKIALEQAGLDPKQMEAAKQLAALSGGTAGTGLGALLGEYLGRRAAESYDLDENISRATGTGLGALLGGGLGGYAGFKAPELLKQRKAQGVQDGTGPQGGRGYGNFDLSSLYYY